MKDQAEKLRELALKVRRQIEEELSTEMQQTRVMVVTSGKGGVGKSTLALNMALGMCAAGKKVVLMDADLGLGNIDIMLGLVPQYNIYHMITNKKSLRDIIITGPDNLKIIPGGSGVSELANLNDEQLRRILVELGTLDGEYDYMIIDTGAGISNNVTSFLLASDDVIVVTTPEPTSLTDAYGVIKTMAREKFGGHIYLVVNRTASGIEGMLTAEKLKIVIKKFLDIDITILGHLPNESIIEEGIRKQEPFIKSFPRSQAAANIKVIARNLMEGNAINTSEPRRGGVKNFFKKLVGLSKK
ncbi:MAG TPA: ATP-binding protein [Syntrophomonas sp.]|jgi:flagellar biosynthesis protein FlhG|nr:ATP-binding protein [Syntrophomonas sp.]HCF70054.1 ATP-binding protein [Syntrophomonas sp.]